MKKDKNKKINVLLLSPLPPPIGGIATWTKNFINEQNNKQKNILIVNTAKRTLFNIPILDEIIRTFDIFKNSIKKLKGEEIEILHINTACSKKGMIREYLIIIYAKVIKKKKIVLHCHCDIKQYINTNSRTKIFKKLCNKVDKILCLNNQSINFVKELGFYSKAQIIENFVNNKKIKKRCIINQNVKNILYVGRITKEKGINELIETAEKNQKLNFYFVGNFERDFDKNKINSLTNIHFLGQMQQDEIYELMSKNDVLILPSYAEGFPMVILEAMFVGIPIITTKVGSVESMLEKDGCIYINIGDSNSINEALKNINSKKIRQNISNRNIKVANEKYCADCIVNKINDVYSELIN